MTIKRKKLLGIGYCFRVSLIIVLTLVLTSRFPVTGICVILARLTEIDNLLEIRLRQGSRKF